MNRQPLPIDDEEPPPCVAERFRQATHDLFRSAYEAELDSKETER